MGTLATIISGSDAPIKNATKGAAGATGGSGENAGDENRENGSEEEAEDEIDLLHLFYIDIELDYITIETDTDLQFILARDTIIKHQVPFYCYFSNTVPKSFLNDTGPGVDRKGGMGISAEMKVVKKLPHGRSSFEPSFDRVKQLVQQYICHKTK